jgi:hypothetical protein
MMGDFEEVSFGDLLKDGNIFCDRLTSLPGDEKRPQLITSPPMVRRMVITKIW